MKQGFGMRKQGMGGLQLVRKPVARQEAGMAVVREGSTGRVVAMVPPASARVMVMPAPVVPRIWAVAETGLVGVPEEVVETPISKCERPHPNGQRTPAGDPGSGAPGLVGGSLEVVETQVRESGPGAPGFGGAPVGVPAGSPPARVEGVVEVAFYRKYTEAMLRRYMRLSMAAGRVPSLMGRELFRGHVTSYKVKSFEDVVIFCHDVEKCLTVLDGRERELIKRIALQAYSQGEAAAILGISLRSCVMLYARTLDKLTRVLLRSKLLEPLKDCQ